MSESKKALIVSRLEPFLEAHARDPKRYPRTLLAYADFVPCARRLLYQADDPEVIAVADRIRGRGAANPPSYAAHYATQPATAAGLTDDDLRAEIERVTARVTWAMQRFVGHHRSPSAADGALALHDLEEILGALRRLHGRLAPLVAELQARQRAQVSTTEAEVLSIPGVG